MKNSDFKQGAPDPDRPTYYSSEEDPHQTTVGDRIAQKARYVRGADARATSHAFKEAARRMVGQGNLQSVLDALDLGLPEFADLTGLSRKVLAAILSGKGHVDAEMEETVSQLETKVCDTSYWFWTDPRKITPEDVRRFNVRYRGAEEAPPEATGSMSQAKSAESAGSVKAESSPAHVSGSLFEESSSGERAASGTQHEAGTGETSWSTTAPKKGKAAPYFSGPAGAQVIRRKRRGSKEGMIAAENLRRLLAALESDAGWLADRMGASAKALKLILTGKGAGDEEALHAVEYLEYPLRGKRGWFWTELYTPTSADLERFNSRYSAHLFQEVPGAPVRRDTLNFRVESANPASVGQSEQPLEAAAEVRQETQAGSTPNEQSETASAAKENTAASLAHLEFVEADEQPEASEEPNLEAAPTADITEAQAQPSVSPEVEESEPEVLPSEGQAATPVAEPAAPLNIFVLDADEVVSKAKPVTAKKSGTGLAKSAKAEAPEHARPEVSPAPEGQAKPPSADVLRIQTVLGNLSRLSAILDLGREDFQRAVGISGEMVGQLRTGLYSPEARQAMRRLEESLFLMAHEFEETHFDPSGFMLEGFEERMRVLLTEGGPTLVQPVMRTKAPAPAAPVAKAHVSPQAKPHAESHAPEPAPKRRGRPSKQPVDTSRQELVAKNLVSLCGVGTKRFGVRAVTGIPAQRMDALLNQASPATMTREEEDLIEEKLFLGKGWFSAKKQKVMAKDELQARVDARIKGKTYQG